MRPDHVPDFEIPFQCAPLPALAADRRATDERTRRDRLDAAVKALAACGLAEFGEYLPTSVGMAGARDAVASVRARLLDGSDEPRFRACNLALEALGRLWACQ